MSKGHPSKSKALHKSSKKHGKNLSKTKSIKKNKKPHQQQNQEASLLQKNNLQNSYGVIDKQKLLGLSSNKQLQIIKQLQVKILAKPQQNIKSFDALFLLTKTSNLKIVANVLRTIANLFISISPLQAIDLKGLQERTQNKITREEFTVVKFQRILVDQYERYIKILKQLKVKLKAEHFGSDQQIFIEFRKCILQCALTCFNTLWNFNFAKELCDLLLQFIKFKECQNAFQNVLEDKNIATVSMKLKIINGIAQLIKNKEDKQLPQDLVKIINRTYIDTRYLQRDRDALNFKKKKMKQRMYKQEAFEKKAQKEKGKQENDKLAQKRKKKVEKIKIKMKIKQQIDKEFAQGQAIISNKQIVRNNSMILQELFYVYFKILVQKISSKFLKDALDGILNFAHLINIDLISNMIEHLNTASKIFRQIWKKNMTNQNLQLRMVIVFTMESILNGPLSVYNMDDISVTSNFYKILRDINANQFKNKINTQVFRLICISLEECFIKRRQLSQLIVGSFIREVSILLARSQFPKLYLLQFLRLTASKYQKVARMFEQDNQGYGINAYNQFSEDPQSTNAINTQVLSKLNAAKKFSKNSKQYERQVVEYINRLSRQNFQRIEGTQSLENMLRDDLQVGSYLI